MNRLFKGGYRDTNGSSVVVSFKIVDSDNVEVWYKEYNPNGNNADVMKLIYQDVKSACSLYDVEDLSPLNNWKYGFRC